VRWVKEDMRWGRGSRRMAHCSLHGYTIRFTWETYSSTVQRGVDWCALTWRTRRREGARCVVRTAAIKVVALSRWRVIMGHGFSMTREGLLEVQCQLVLV